MDDDQRQRIFNQHRENRQERQRRLLTRELRDLQSDPQSQLTHLSRAERRIAAASAAKARLDARTGKGEQSSTSSSGQRVDGRKRSGRYPKLYDENGTHLNSGQNFCDCLDVDCPGCHFPCKLCGSLKCGRKCRSERKWIYTQAVEQNPFEESMVIRTKPV